MKRFFKDNLAYYLIYLVLLAVVGYYLLAADKVSIHRRIISLTGHPFTDTVYVYLTWLGDGIFAALLALMVGYVNMRNGAYVLFAYVVSGLISAGLKTYVFANINRPFFIWQWTLREELPRIEGVDVLIHNSFPSGHATTAFAVFTCLALITNNQLLKLLCLFVALNAAFSRTYISQHWLVDVYFGSIIGLGTATILYFVVYGQKFKFMNGLNRPMFQAKP